MQNEITKNPVAEIRGYISNPDVRKRLEEMLGKRAGAFANSIVNVVKNNKMLQECKPDSIMSSSMVAASMNLPIDPALGYAAIVPYRCKTGGAIAQFQLMYRGVIQLCIRSGQYAKIHCTEIYKDELKSHNPILGEVEFNDISKIKMRYETNGEGVIDPTNVVGAFAYFKLLTGFECLLFMNKEELLAHGKRFSKAYQYDIAKNQRTSLWSTDPVSMFRKTVIKMMLLKYGIMSIELQEAFVEESKDFNDALTESENKISTEAGSEMVDAEFEDPSSQQPASPETDNQPAASQGAQGNGQINENFLS